MSSVKFCNIMLHQQNKQLFGIAGKLLSKQQLRTATGAATATKPIEQNAQLTNAQIEWESARPYKEIPMISAFQLIRGVLPGGKYYKMDFIEMLKKIHDEHGQVVRFPKLFGRPEIVETHNYEDFERVYRNEGIWPSRPGVSTLAYHRQKHQAEFYKNAEGLVASEGEEWSKFRSAVNPVMMQPKNIRLYLQKIANVNWDFIERIKEIRDPKTNEVPDNFESTIHLWTLESVSVVALDKELGLLKQNRVDPLAQQLIFSITEFFRLAPEIEGKPSVWKIIPTPSFKRLMKALDNVQAATSHFVSQAMKRLEQERKNGIEKPESEKSILEKLLKIDRSIAIVMAMDMMMAGVDTTSSTFTGIMLCLAKNPEKQAKLREEIRRIQPNKDSQFTEQSLNDMSYLRACIKESLRIYPLANGNARVVQNDIVVSGYRVPKGTPVSMLTTSVNLDEQIYPRAKEFLPERWLRTQANAEANACPKSLKASSPFVYLPFGFGPRSCIGRRIAEMELELGVARIIRNFNVSFNYPTEKAFRMLFLNVPNIPLKFQFTDVEF